MKILSITLENINSLKGTFTIPLEQFLSDNALVFAITGPTGSGKTSILDAVCAALYGRTPRLSGPSDMAELMTHHTAQCMAEVTFTINDKKYRARYERHRAQKKATGRLQDATMELVDEDTRTIIASSKSSVPMAVERITGLDFNRFCKSILLAQGSFDAFLKAGRDDRALLLEKITGTQIYSMISTTAFEKNKAEKDRLIRIQDQLSALQLLSADGIELFQTQLTSTIDSIKQIRQTQKKLADDNVHFKALAECRTIKTQCEKDLTELEKQEHTAQSELSMLARSRQTRPFLGAYQQLNQADLNLQNLNKTKKQLEHDLPATREQLETAAKNQRVQQQKLAAFKNDLGQKQAIIDPIRQHLPLLKDKLARKNDLAGQVKTFQEKKEKLVRQSKTIKGQLDAAARSSAAIEGQYKALIRQKKELEDKKQTLLSGQSMADLEKQALEHQACFDQLTKENQCLRDIELMETKKAAFIEEAEKIQADLKKRQSDQTALETQLMSLKESLKNLKKQREFEIKIHKLEALRNELIPNEPCPLCGSPDHPFQRKKPGKTQITLKIEQEENQLEEKNRLREDHQKNMVTLSSGYEHLTEQLEQIRQSILDHTQQLSKIRSGHTLSSIEPALKAAKLSALHFIEQISALKQIQSHISRTDNDIQDHQNRRFETNQAVQKAQMDLERISLRIEQNKEETAALTRQIEGMEKELGHLSQSSPGFEKISLLSLKSDIFKPAALEQELTALLNRLDSDLADITHLADISGQQVIVIQTALSDKTKALDNCRQQIEQQTREYQTLDEKFTQAIQKKGFHDLAHFMTFLLDDEALNRLEDLEKQLSGKRVQLQTLFETNEKKLNHLLSQPRDHTDLAALERIIQKADEDLAAATKTQAELEFKLAENERLQTRHQDLLKDEAAQIKECSKWACLNELIGQKDGAKFRLFAQNLTLEQLIYQANQYLCLFNNRYILEKNQDSALDIMVIDTFFADRIRPMENLSGGETFLISLSLALGLSDITSAQTNIESLFLDEGFGTLDKDTLEIALAAIDTLNASGKTVCIISHVEALKERIHLKVEVIPVAQGISRISLSA